MYKIDVNKINTIHFIYRKRRKITEFRKKLQETYILDYLGANQQHYFKL